MSEQSDKELIANWNPYFILLSYGVSFVGSYVGVSLCEQYRLSCTNPYKKYDLALFPTVTLVLIAISIGGVAVWCMHFVGMAAIILKTHSEVNIKIGYDYRLTIASIFAVVFSVFCGLLIASRDRAFTKTKEEILGMIVDDARKSGVKITSKLSIMVLASLKGIETLMAGGLVTAAGVCTMHYLGMMSMRFDGRMEWEAGVIAASVAIAFVVSTIAFWILFRLLALYPYMEWLRVASAAVMGVAVNAMHYTGMYGAKYYYDPTMNTKMNSGYVVSTGLSFSIALVFAMITVFILVIAVIRDLRHWLKYCSDLINKTDEIFSKAAKAPTSHVDQFLAKYKELRGISFAEQAVEASSPPASRQLLESIKPDCHKQSVALSEAASPPKRSQFMLSKNRSLSTIGEKKCMNKMPLRAPKRVAVVSSDIEEGKKELCHHLHDDSVQRLGVDGSTTTQQIVVI